MAKSGDTREQQGPDGLTPEQEEALQAARVAAEVTLASPPNFAGVITRVDAQVVDFPIFHGGKAIDFQASCGPLTLHLHLDPSFAEAVCGEIMGAANAARSGLRPASMQEVAALTGAKG